MQVPAKCVGPQFKFQRKKQYELHMNRMSEIMKRSPQTYGHSSHNLHDPLVSSRQRNISAENQRMYSKLVEISSRKVIEHWSNRESELMQRYKATLRKRRLQKIRQENLSLADRLTKRLTGGYSHVQRDIDTLRTVLPESSRQHPSLPDSFVNLSRVQLPPIPALTQPARQ